jgi:hypothetical protein
MTHTLHTHCTDVFTPICQYCVERCMVLLMAFFGLCVSDDLIIHTWVIVIMENVIMIYPICLGCREVQIRSSKPLPLLKPKQDL